MICEHHTWRHRALKVAADLETVGESRALSA
jgi:hypothetical protein